MSLADGAIGGPGVLLPPPQSLYPSGLYNADSIPANNQIALAPGQAMPIPRGSWWISLGGYAVLQALDPVTTVWRMVSSAHTGPLRVTSDGNNYRVANLTSCPVGAVITNAGTALYTSTTTTVTASAGGSTWLPIIGGQPNTTITTVSAGSGYGLPPLLFIDAPPSPGLQMMAYAAITNGTVSSVTTTQQGAGYLSAPKCVAVPNPYDPNLLAGNAITAATFTTALVTASGTPSAGKLTALLCSNNGAAVASAPTLTVAGGGASAAATAVMLWTVTNATASTVGAGAVAANEVTTTGGIPTATAVWTNPIAEYTNFIPRKASLVMASASGTVSTVSTIYDGGLFAGTPTAMYLQNGLSATTSPTIALTLGGTTALVYLQPAG